MAGCYRTRRWRGNGLPSRKRGTEAIGAGYGAPASGIVAVRLKALIVEIVTVSLLP